jgi:hypothetical protein
MKSTTLTLTGLIVTLASGTVSAHPGEHHALICLPDACCRPDEEGAASRTPVCPNDS